VPTMRNIVTTVREGADHEPGNCIHCRRPIIWLTTCHNLRRLAFDPDTMPSKWDDGNGWAPGTFPIRATPRLCFAPLPMHPPAKRRRISHVMRLHNCRQAA
jgi:hypothetical protein